MSDAAERESADGMALRIFMEMQRLRWKEARVAYIATEIQKLHDAHAAAVAAQADEIQRLKGEIESRKADWERDYKDMRSFQRKFISADQGMREEARLRDEAEAALKAAQEERDEARRRAKIDQDQCDSMTTQAGELAVALAAAREEAKRDREALARMRASIKAATACAHEWSYPDVVDGKTVPPHSLADWVQHAEARHFAALSALSRQPAEAPSGDWQAAQQMRDESVRLYSESIRLAERANLMAGWPKETVMGPDVTFTVPLAARPWPPAECVEIARETIGDPEIACLDDNDLAIAIARAMRRALLDAAENLAVIDGDRSVNDRLRARAARYAREGEGEEA
jgi:hypothetical protein